MDTSHRKAEIRRLRNEGKTYAEIADTIGCNKSMVSYHLDHTQKDKTAARTRKYRAADSLVAKTGQFKGKTVANKVRDFQRRDGSHMGVVTHHFSPSDVRNAIGEAPTCHITGDAIDLNRPSSYTFDHYIPASRGGDNSLSNLRLATKRSNAMKGDMMMSELIDLCAKVLRNHGYTVADPTKDSESSVLETQPLQEVRPVSNG